VYFKKIIEELKKADQIVLYGPAETYERLLKELQQNAPKIASRVKEASSADSMTINQIKAKVRDYFIPSARSQA
jgi:stalled ribosome rescue protein Dom34